MAGSVKVRSHTRKKPVRKRSGKRSSKKSSPKKQTSKKSTRRKRSSAPSPASLPKVGRTGQAKLF
jgi:hypothetical protein